jgi:RNA polymerase sigma-70 factor (ECF subfamily)
MSNPATAARPAQTTDDLLDAPDDLLFEACRADDARAFRILVNRHGAMVRRLALNILRDEQEAEDAAQEAFVSIWRNRASWRPEARFTTWLYRIAMNKAIDRYRSRRMPTESQEVITQMVDAAVDANDGAEQHQALETKQLSASLRRAMEALPKTQRTALALFYFEDLEVAAIAKAMLTSEQSVRALLKRGRQALKTQVQKQQTTHGSRRICRASGDLRG